MMEGATSISWMDGHKRLRYLPSVLEISVGGSQTYNTFLDTSGIDIPALGSTTIERRFLEILETERADLSDTAPSDTTSSQPS